ncbi:hypothetical protein CFREI_01640 [Corynebacterium freiburgense]|nr:hypothetical protein CFREI_01640 [Corynebacterium freiburgense]
MVAHKIVKHLAESLVIMDGGNDWGESIVSNDVLPVG